MENVNMRKFGLIMNLSMNTVLGFIMTTVALLGQHNFTLENLLTGAVVSLGIGYLVSDVVPAIPFSEKVTANIQNPIIKHLASTAIVAVCFITLISFGNTFVATGFNVFKVWPQTLPLGFIQGYCVLIFVLPVIKKFAIMLATEK